MDTIQSSTVHHEIDSPITTIAQAQEVYTARYAELTHRARHYFRDYLPEARDDATSNALFLTWHYLVKLVQQGKATDKTLLSSLYYACKQTRGGRELKTVKHDRFRELWNHAKHDTGIDLDGFVNGHNSVLDVVSFKIDTEAWLESLTEHQRSRAIDMSDGSKTSELAQRWHVSPGAVSLYRRQLNESYHRFMGE